MAVACDANSQRSAGGRSSGRRVEPVTASVLGGSQFPGAAFDSLAAELASYNHAFAELELPWRWDAALLAQLKSMAAEGDLVGAYVERNQAHLLRAYEKAFLCDLVYSARARHRQDGTTA